MEDLVVTMFLAIAVMFGAIIGLPIVFAYCDRQEEKMKKKARHFEGWDEK